MDDLLDYLYMYTTERRMPRALQPVWLEYNNLVRQCDRQMDDLKAALGDERWEELDDFLTVQNDIQAMNMEAMFRAALGLGLRLARLAD